MGRKFSLSDQVRFDPRIESADLAKYLRAPVFVRP